MARTGNAQCVVEAGAPLADFLDAEADALGWCWFSRSDETLFHVWNQHRLATVAVLATDEGPRFEVATDLGLCLLAGDAALAIEMLFGALVFGADDVIADRSGDHGDEVPG